MNVVNFYTPFKKGKEHIMFGKPAWNRGKKYPHSPEWEAKRIAAVRKAAVARRGIPTGRPPTEKVRNALNEWRKNNPDKVRENAIRNLSKNGTLSLSKENSPQWLGGITEDWQKWKSEHGNDFEKWRLSIYKRDNKTCRNCGSTDHIQAHHIVSVKSHKCFAFLPMNGVCLCFRCHSETDNFGGREARKEIGIGTPLCTMITIPHKFQEYPTCGNYGWGTGGELLVFASDLKNSTYESLIFLHEFVEAFLTKKWGIKNESITNFDIDFENRREAEDFSEPGDHPKSPYKIAHCIASGIERIMAAAQNVCWADYESKINAL